ncbi:MAG: glutathione S-transferase [Rhodobacteraceae bacterium]|nr:glutathione S-transferase [Paracoccaceae bacterium]
MKLYYAKGTAALPVHIALEETGAAYDTQVLDFAKGEQQSAAYLAINPKGRVPALAVEDGILTEALAILGYIAQSFPNAALAPTDPFGFARAMAFNGYLASTVHVAHAHKRRGARWADDAATHDAMRAKVAQNMTDCARVIEAHYLDGPWVLGDSYSICDPYLFTITRWMPADGVDMSEFSRLTAHTEAMMQRPAVQRVVALHS